MGFNCQNCLSKCKAVCCGPVPLEVNLVEKNRHKLVRPIIEEKFFEGPVMEENSFSDLKNVKTAEMVLMTSEGNYCPFLTEDYKCNIYEDRPFVCKEFGKETHPLMRCSFQDKDGRVRSRQETRSIEREQKKRVLVLHNLANKTYKI